METNPQQWYRTEAAQRKRRSLTSAICVGIILALLLARETSIAYADSFLKVTPPPAPGLEADVELHHQVIGIGEADAFILGKTLYLDPVAIFRFVHVHASLSDDENVLSGFYIDEKRAFVMDFKEGSITYADHRFKLAEDAFVARSGCVYLKSDMLEKVFGLRCAFNDRLLRVDITSPEKLPAETEMEDRNRRKHMQTGQDAGVPIPDRRFELTRSLFSLGTLDWSFSGLYANPVPGGNYQFLLGTQFLGGDLDAAIYGMYKQKIDWMSTPWRWRLPVQNSSMLSSILIGRRASFSNLQLADSMVGMQISNIRPTAYSSASSTFSNYTISDRTEPDWLVELYVNEQLVSYVKADQTGHYQFVIPLRYGSTDVRLRFIGPFGEVRTKDLAFQIPYTFLAPGTVGYTLTAGAPVKDPRMNNSVAKMNVQMGVSTAMTLGGGLRYSHDELGQPHYSPFASGSFRLSKDILASGEYYHKIGVRSHLDLTGSLGFALGAEYDASFSGTPTLLDDVTIQDQRSVRLNTPLPWSLGALRLDATDYPINTTQGSFQLEGVLTLSVLRSILSVSAYSYYSRDRFKLESPSDIMSNIALTLPPIIGLQFRPQTDVDVTTRHAIDLGISVAKYFGLFGSLSVSGLHNFDTRSNSLLVSFGMNLPFAQTGISTAMSSGQPIQYNGSMMGSLVYDPALGSLFPVNRPEVRTGGITVVPFLDQNNNGKRDPGEPIVQHVAYEQVPGTPIKEDDGTLRVLGIEPYVPYYFKTSMSGVDNAALMPKFSTFEVTPPANGFAKIELPILTVGQVEGFVMQTSIKGQQPTGGYRIKIRHDDKEDTSAVIPEEDLLTYSNGEYFYLGLTPGRYRLCIDPEQLRLMHATAVPAFIDVEIHNVVEGDVVEGMNFVVTSRPEITTPSDDPNRPIIAPAKPNIKK
jgi:hypothetical protein